MASARPYVRAPKERAKRPELDGFAHELASLLDRRLDERGVSNLEVQRATGIEESMLRRMRRGQVRLSVAAAIVIDRHFGLGLVAAASQFVTQGG